jgi:hypothetical protein
MIDTVYIRIVLGGKWKADLPVHSGWRSIVGIGPSVDICKWALHDGFPPDADSERFHFCWTDRHDFECRRRPAEVFGI